MTHTRGSGLIEIVIGSSLIALSLVGVLVTFQLSISVNRETGRATSAQFLVHEGIEVMRMFRDATWANISSLSTTTPYYLEYSSGWSTTTTPLQIDGVFVRTVSVEDVFRDGNDDIAPTGTYDALFKKITVTVAWDGKEGTSTRSTSTYIGNIFE